MSSTDEVIKLFNLFNNNLMNDELDEGFLNLNY